MILLSYQIKINTLFKSDHERKRSKYDTDIHEAMIFHDGIFKPIESCL